MVIAELVVVLDKASYRPGETVAGEVRVRLDEDHPCRVEVRLNLRPLETVMAFDGRLAARAWKSIRFALELPADAPLTIDGFLEWSVVATAQLPLAFDERKEAGFEVADPALYPRVLPREVQATRSGIGHASSVAVPGVLRRTGGRTSAGSLVKDLAKLGVGTGLVSAGAAIVALTKGLGTLHAAALMVPGAMLSRPAVNRLRRHMAERRVGVVRVEYAIELDDDGPRLALRVWFEPALADGAVSARLRLTCLGMPQASNNPIVPVSSVEGALVRAAENRDLFEGSLPLPSRPIRSGPITPAIRVQWALEVRIDLPRWPDWVETFPLEVVPARRETGA